MAVLQEKQDKIHIMREVHDMNINQIAKELDMHYMTVKRILDRNDISPMAKRVIDARESSREKETIELIENVKSSRFSNIFATMMEYAVDEDLIERQARTDYKGLIASMEKIATMKLRVMEYEQRQDAMQEFNEHMDNMHEAMINVAKSNTQFDDVVDKNSKRDVDVQ